MFVLMRMPANVNDAVLSAVMSAAVAMMIHFFMVELLSS
jgi:hypothetical protein